jgi:hypothetical protein
MWKFAEETTTDREKPAENEHLKILKTLYLHVNVESSLSYKNLSYVVCRNLHLVAQNTTELYNRCIAIQKGKP